MSEIFLAGRCELMSVVSSVAKSKVASCGEGESNLRDRTRRDSEECDSHVAG